MPTTNRRRPRTRWLHPDNLLVLALLLCAFGSPARADERAHDLGGALERAERALGDHEPSPAQLGDSNAAIADLERALDAHFNQRADAARGLILLGQLLEKAGRSEDALEAYRRVRTHFPEQGATVRSAGRHASSLRDGRGLFLQQLLRRADLAVGKQQRSGLVDMRVSGVLVVHDDTGELEPRQFTTEVASGGRIRQLHPGRDTASGFDGTQGWRLDPTTGRTVNLDGPALDRLVAWAEETWREARAALLPGTRTRLIGARRVQGKPAWTVEFSSPSGRRLVHFDDQTALPVMVEGRFLSLDGREVDRVYLFDYQAVSECLYATRTVYYNGDRIAYEFRFKKIELNPGLDPAIFSPPTTTDDESTDDSEKVPSEPQPEAPPSEKSSETRPTQLPLEDLVTHLQSPDNDLAERSAIELYRRRDLAAVAQLIEILADEEQRKPRRPLHGLILQVLRTTTGLNLETASDWRDAWKRRQGDLPPR